MTGGIRSGVFCAAGCLPETEVNRGRFGAYKTLPLLGGSKTQQDTERHPRTRS